MFSRGDEVTVRTNGEELDGRVAAVFEQGGQPMVEIDLEEPHWATGETWMETPQSSVRPIPPAV